jgi:hypothetical protein
MPKAEQMVESIRTYCRAETEGDKQAFMGLFADKVLHEDPVGVAVRHDRAGLDELWSMAQAGNVELWLDDDVIVCGGEAMAIMRCRVGPADNRREIGPIIDHFVFDEAGRITSVRSFYKYA